MEKCIVTCAVTGAETTRRENPALPLSPAEIADAAADACRAGASVLHLHVRDSAGNPTQDVAVFRETIELVRRKCDIVIEVTTGGAVGMTPEERLAPVTLDPEMASLDCGSVNFGNDYLVNTLPVMREFASAMAARKVRPTLECFDLSHIYGARKLIEEGLVEEPFHFGLVLNVPGGVPYSLDILSFFVRSLPQGSFWTAMGIGKASVPAVLGAAGAGGNVRVGFEDNVYYSRGVLAKSNAELVERAARIAREAGREPASPGDVRKMLALRG
jgi:3-keto-5-aminohexanoate cleavage enzyme